MVAFSKSAIAFNNMLLRVRGLKNQLRLCAIGLIVMGVAVINNVWADVTQPMQPTAQDVQRIYVQQQLRDLPLLLSQALVTGQFQGREDDGFVITEIVQSSLYEKIGLKDGDVIQKINGEQVSSSVQALRMYVILQQATTIDLQVRRGKSVKTVRYNIQ